MPLRPTIDEGTREYQRARTRGSTGMPAIVELAVTERGLVIPGQHALIEFKQDFMLLPIAAAGVSGWVVDNVGALTTALSHVANGVGGSVVFAPGATAGNNAHYQWANNATVLQPFTMTAGKRLWLTTRFKIENFTRNLPIIGLHSSQTNPWSTEPADQFLLRIPSASAQIQFAAGPTNTTERTANLHQMASDTFYTYMLYYDGAGGGYAWAWNDNMDLLGTGQVDMSSTFLPNDPMTVAFGNQATDTSADDMTVDHIHVYMER